MFVNPLFAPFLPFSLSLSLVDSLSLSLSLFISPRPLTIRHTRRHVQDLLLCHVSTSLLELLQLGQYGGEGRPVVCVERPTLPHEGVDLLGTFLWPLQFASVPHKV